MKTCKECGSAYSVSSWKVDNKTCPNCKDSQKKEDAAFERLLEQSNPRFFITPILLTLNVVVFAIMGLSGVSVLNPTVEELVTWGANFGPLTVNQEWWRLFSATFVHIGVLHIALNMWVLWALGKRAERMFGNWTFLLLYLLSGLGGSVASLWWNPTVVSAGASGAIFGIAGGQIAFLRFGEIQAPKGVMKRNLMSVLLFVFYNVQAGLTASGIDNAAHLGGLAIGLLLGALLHRPVPASERPTSPRYYVVPLAVALSLILGAGFAKSRVASDPVARYIHASKLLEAGDLDQAIMEFEKALEGKPSFAEGHHDLGVAYLRQGLYDKAVKRFRRAIQLKPDLASAHFNLALALQVVGNNEEAEVEFKKAKQLDPSLEPPELRAHPQVPQDEPPKADKPKKATKKKTKRRKKLRAACRTGSAKECFELGLMWWGNGEDGPTNISKARRWVKKACALNHQEACGFLPMMKDQ